jgi:hypothetical protein
MAIDPTFMLSAAVGGADADVIADGQLIDFKAGKGRTLISATEIYQLLGYVLLDLDNRYGITTVGIHALRWRTRWVVALDDLLSGLAGVRRTMSDWREMFADMLLLYER